MNFPIFINKFVLNFKLIKHTPFFYWFRLINHNEWRLDDNIRYWDFWNAINQGYDHMNYVHKFEEFWGVGSYPPEKIILSAENFDALQKRLAEPADPEAVERVREILRKKAPWEEDT